MSFYLIDLVVLVVLAPPLPAMMLLFIFSMIKRVFKMIISEVFLFPDELYYFNTMGDFFYYFMIIVFKNFVSINKA